MTIESDDVEVSAPIHRTLMLRHNFTKAFFLGGLPKHVSVLQERLVVPRDRRPRTELDKWCPSQNATEKHPHPIHEPCLRPECPNALLEMQRKSRYGCNLIAVGQKGMGGRGGAGTEL
jgi:hypothetical protein